MTLVEEHASRPSTVNILCGEPHENHMAMAAGTAKTTLLRAMKCNKARRHGSAIRG